VATHFELHELLRINRAFKYTMGSAVIPFPSQVEDIDPNLEVKHSRLGAKGPPLVGEEVCKRVGT
jgi:hypothetical protein